MNKLYIKGIVLLSIIALVIFINPLYSFARPSERINLKDCVVTVTPVTYNGKPQKPTVTVTYKGTTVSSSNYTYKSDSYTDAKSYPITISGKNFYTGSVTKDFVIYKKSIKDTSIKATPTSFTYNGAKQKPTVTITSDGKTLKSGTDYSIIIPVAINPGDYIITINGKGNFNGTATVGFSIEENKKKNIANLDKYITLSQSSYIYDGNPKYPTVTITDGSKELVKNKDYTLEYKNNTNAGTAKVIIKGIGQYYVGSKTKNFNIARKDINYCSAYYQKYAFFSGKSITRTIKISDNGKYLVLGTDYNVSYKNNKLPGTAIITVTGCGNYCSTATYTFTIYKKPISNCNIDLSETNFYYDGTEKKPTVIAYDGTKQLKDGTDYTVTYSQNKEEGTATATIYGVGTYYTGTCIKTFNIVKKDINNYNIESSSIKYTGEAKRPTITVKNSSETLKEGTDYVIRYKAKTDYTSVGEKIFSVTGINKYKGSKVSYYTIIPRSLDDCRVIIDDENNITFDGNKKTPSITVLSVYGNLEKGKDYTVSYENNINAGTAKVVVKGIGNYSDKIIKNFTIKRKSLNNFTATPSPDSYTYDGTKKEPDVIVNNGLKDLTRDVDYTVTYYRNTNAGKAIAIITGIGNYSGTKSISFTINQSSIDGGIYFLFVTNDKSDLVYDGTQKNIITRLKDASSQKELEIDKDYKIKFSSNSIVNPGKYIVTAIGIGNYCGEKKLQFEITKRPVSNCCKTTIFSIYHCHNHFLRYYYV